jgi:hypothetical protein
MNINSNKTLRLHDQLYLKENRYKRPKEMFISILKLIKKSKVDIKKNLKINHKDYIKSWTFNSDKNKKIIMNGTNLLHCF